MTEASVNPGTSRRSVLKAAAWAAPVIAVAVAAPLASASITSSSVAVTNSGSASLNGPNAAGSTVNAVLAGSGTVTNQGTAWSIDGFTAEYSLEGPVTGTTFFLFEGSPISSSTITSGGYTWTVEANVEGYVLLSLVAPLPVSVPVNGSTTVPVPTLTISDTLTNSAQSLPLSRRVRASLKIAVQSGAGSIGDQSTKSIPA